MGDCYKVASWQPRVRRSGRAQELLEKGAVVETFPVNGDFTRQQESWTFLST